MIALLSDLVRLFARDGLTVDDVVRTIGPITQDPGVPMPMELQPTTHGVRAAALARYPDTLLPYLLILDFDGGEQPTVGELSSAFGSFGVLPRDRGMPTSLRFEPILPPTRWTVALVATLAGQSAPKDGDEASRVVLQRERASPSADAAASEAHP